MKKTENRKKYDTQRERERYAVRGEKRERLLKDSLNINQSSITYKGDTLRVTLCD